jgi:hypothetical protein
MINEEVYQNRWRLIDKTALQKHNVIVVPVQQIISKERK